MKPGSVWKTRATVKSDLSENGWAALPVMNAVFEPSKTAAGWPLSAVADTFGGVVPSVPGIVVVCVNE